MTDRNVRVFLTAVTSQYQAAMARAKATATDFGASAARAGTQWTKTGTSFMKTGKAMSQAGSTMTRRVSLPLVALGAGALKTSIDFESAFTGVRKTIDATEKQYRELEKGIQSMSEKVPASVEEISAVAEAAGQLGIQRENILGFTKTMIDLGESTNLTADTAATSLARLANITKMPQDQFDRLGSTIVDLGNKGASTEAEITEMGLRIAGAGSQVGMSIPQILAFAESLSSVGISAEAGGSAISRTFIEIANAAASGGKDLERFANVAGMSSAEFKASFEGDAASATITFIEGLARMKKEGVNVFKVLEDLKLGEIRVRDALLRASGAGDLFRKSQVTGAKAWKENTALAEESSKRYSDNAAKLEMLKNKFRNIMAQFGDDMMPILHDAAEALGDLAKWFNGLNKEQRENIMKWGAIAIAAGPVLRIFGGITTALGGIMKLGGGATRMLGAVLGAGKGKGVPGTPGAAAPGFMASHPVLTGATLAVVAAAAVDQYLDFQARQKTKTEIGNFGKDTGLGGGGAIGDRAVEGVGGGLVTGGGALQGAVATIRSGEEFGKRLGRQLVDNASAAADFKAKLQALADGADSADEKTRILAMGTMALNKAQKVAARLVSAEKDRLDNLNGTLDATQQKRLDALVASGNYAAAMDLLLDAEKHVAGQAKELGKGFDDAGADADEAMQKMNALGASIRALPSSKTITIDTLMRTFTVNGTETQTGKEPLGKAGGGPVKRGLSYLVGERGPEIFEPDVGGRIIPNSRLSRAMSMAPSSGVSTAPNIEININGGNLAEVRRVVEDTIRGIEHGRVQIQRARTGASR